MAQDTKLKGEEIGFQDGVRYSIRQNEESKEYEVHAHDYIHEKEKVLKSFKTREGAITFAEEFLDN